MAFSGTDKWPTGLGDRRMRGNFLLAQAFYTSRGPGHPCEIPATSQLPSLETQGRQSFKGGHELFGHHPFARRPPPHAAVSGPKKLIFVFFFLAWYMADRIGPLTYCTLGALFWWAIFPVLGGSEQGGLFCCNFCLGNPSKTLRRPLQRTLQRPLRNHSEIWGFCNRNESLDTETWLTGSDLLLSTARQSTHLWKIQLQELSLVSAAFRILRGLPCCPAELCRPRHRKKRKNVVLGLARQTKAILWSPSDTKVLRNFRGNLRPQNLRDGKTFSGNYAWNS